MTSKKRAPLSIGAHYHAHTKSTSFRVWAPRVKTLELEVSQKGKKQRYGLTPEGHGYFSTECSHVLPGEHYTYVLDSDKNRPDPASQLQPQGVHGPSEVVNPKDFVWKDKRWKGLSHLSDFIFYEAHVGTFTPQGTFESMISKIPYLKKLGITCLELMPLTQFPGARNWGYDGVGLFAVQNSYGGPRGLKSLVDACHQAGIAVCLDVVYNHLGPEGNYLNDYGPYFTSKYHTPWGEALNYDDVDSDPVRAFVIANALYWIREFHVDALRLDAVHGIYDFSAKHLLKELTEAVKAQAKTLGRTAYVIAESDQNDRRLLDKPTQGGYGLDGQWCDDFHHAVHVTLTQERNGYYSDFQPVEHLKKVWKDTFVYDGTYCPSRRRHYGSSVRHLPKSSFVVCTQNHDQVGNRAYGERLKTLTNPSAERLSAVLLLLSPFTPLLFMGQEYGETNPFLYFVDHGDENLLKAVRQGRKKEFASFGWKNTPDPASVQTFERSKLNWSLLRQKKHQQLFKLYQDTLHLRKKWGIAASRPKISHVFEAKNKAWLALSYEKSKGNHYGIFFCFSKTKEHVKLPSPYKKFRMILNTESFIYGGTHKNNKKSFNSSLILEPESAIAGKLI